MKHIHYGAIIVGAIILFAIVNYWDNIMAFFSRTPKDGDKCALATDPMYIEGIIKGGKCVSKTPSPVEGSSCITTDNHSGTIVHGICYPNQVIIPVPKASNQLEIVNPNGSTLYYQSPLQSGGLIYSKSNVVLPAGTKLTLVNIWQDTSTFGKYFYETTYQIQGRNGFFKTEDIKITP